MLGLMRQLEEVRGRLAKIQCGPLPFSPHNIKGVDPHVLAPVVVSVMNECSRVLQGLVPSVHRPNWIVPEVELNEALALPVAKAVAFVATFRLERTTPVMAQKPEDLPDFDQPPDPLIESTAHALVFSDLVRKKKGSKRATVRLGRRRAPPEWDAATPPVHNVLMLDRPETISKPRVLMGLPDPYYPHPRGERWRHYCHLHGIPYFSPPATPGSGGHRLRYFR